MATSPHNDNITAQLHCVAARWFMAVGHPISLCRVFPLSHGA